MRTIVHVARLLRLLHPLCSLWLVYCQLVPHVLKTAPTAISVSPVSQSTPGGSCVWKGTRSNKHGRMTSESNGVNDGAHGVRGCIAMCAQCPPPEPVEPVVAREMRDAVDEQSKESAREDMY